MIEKKLMEYVVKKNHKINQVCLILYSVYTSIQKIAVVNLYI